MKKFIILITILIIEVVLILLPIKLPTKKVSVEVTNKPMLAAAKKKKKSTIKINKNTNSFKGFITHYGPNCKGCSGKTASGYNVKNTIYYNDWQYGKVRVVATSKQIPLYSIIRINDYKKGSIIAIVLDRGVSGNKIDVLVSSEKKAVKLGIQKNASVDILRWGKR